MVENSQIVDRKADDDLAEARDDGEYSDNDDSWRASGSGFGRGILIHFKLTVLESEKRTEERFLRMGFLGWGSTGPACRPLFQCGDDAGSTPAVRVTARVPLVSRQTLLIKMNVVIATATHEIAINRSATFRAVPSRPSNTSAAERA